MKNDFSSSLYGWKPEQIHKIMWITYPIFHSITGKKIVMILMILIIITFILLSI